MLLSSLLERASQVGKRVPQQTELDHFAAFVESGAIITSVTAHSVTAEGAESTRSYKPVRGLTDGDYRRLAYDDLSRESLAWGVIENMLGRKGLSRSQIAYTKRSVTDEVLPILVEHYPFEIVAEALSHKGVEYVESRKVAGDRAPLKGDSFKEMAAGVSETVGSDLKPALSVLDNRLSSIEALLKRMNETEQTVHTRIEPEYLSTVDAARFLGVDTTTLDYLRKSRKLRCVQVGDQRGFVYPIADLRDFASKKTLETAGESLKRHEAKWRGRR
jgi:hypothetical protein